MKKYKREDELYSSIANFLIAGVFFKYIIGSSLIAITLIGYLNYQNHAYDHIRVFAQSADQDSFLSYFNRENVAFNLTLETESEKHEYKNVKTPYSIKIPKGERIKVEVKAESKFICCTLKNGGSSVAGSLEKQMKLERIANHFKINCP